MWILVWIGWVSVFYAWNAKTNATPADWGTGWLLTSDALMHGSRQCQRQERIGVGELEAGSWNSSCDSDWTPESGTLPKNVHTELPAGIFEIQVMLLKFSYSVANLYFKICAIITSQQCIQWCVSLHVK